MYYNNEDTSRDNQLYLNDRDFRIAFSFESTLEEKLIYDPSYVRWIFREYGFQDNEWYEKILPYHVCADEDYA